MEAVRLSGELWLRVAVMDVIIPVMDGVDACRYITDLLPDTRVLVLTASSAHEAVVEAVAAGAAKYLLKDSRADRLVEAVREVAVGSSQLTPVLVFHRSW